MPSRDPLICVGGPDDGRKRVPPQRGDTVAPMDGRHTGQYRVRRVLDETVLIYERANCPECTLGLVKTADVTESKDGRLCIDFACASCGHTWRERH